jgi:hypothetical protein
MISDTELDEQWGQVNASPASTVYLFADFVVCPTEPFKKGSVQEAKVKSAVHRHYVRIN